MHSRRPIFNGSWASCCENLPNQTIHKFENRPVIFLQQLRASRGFECYVLRMKINTNVGRQHLQSASQRKLIVPCYHMNSYGRRCFAVAGPSTWNSLPDSLRDPALSLTILGVS